MRAPSFRCTDAEKGNNLILHYYSEREGLQDIVIGIIKTVAQQIHGTEIEMKVCFAVLFPFFCAALKAQSTADDEWRWLHGFPVPLKFMATTFSEVFKSLLCFVSDCVCVCVSGYNWGGYNLKNKQQSYKVTKYPNGISAAPWRLQFSSEFLANVCDSEDIFRSKL